MKLDFSNLDKYTLQDTIRFGPDFVIMPLAVRDKITQSCIDIEWKFEFKISMEKFTDDLRNIQENKWEPILADFNL